MTEIYRRQTAQEEDRGLDTLSAIVTGIVSSSPSRTSPSLLLCPSADDDGDDEENADDDEEGAKDNAAEDGDDDTDGGPWSAPAPPSSPGAARSHSTSI